MIENEKKQIKTESSWTQRSKLSVVGNVNGTAAHDTACHNHDGVDHERCFWGRPIEITAAAAAAAIIVILMILILVLFASRRPEGRRQYPR